LSNITIVVPVFNGESTISKSLESIQKQNYRDFEVLVVDDGSTDNTESEVKKFSMFDDRYKYIYQDNQGVSAARNKGIILCRSKYITFVDDDDYLEINHLANLLSPYTDNNIDLVVSGLVYENNEKTLLKTLKGKKYLDDIDSLNSIFCVKGIEGVTVNKLFKIKIIRNNNILFDTKLTKYEDHVFCFRYLLESRATYYNGLYTYHYVKNIGSAIQNSDNLDFSRDMRACDLMDGYLNKYSAKFKSLRLNIGLMKLDICTENYLKTSNIRNKKVSKEYIKKNLHFKHLFEVHDVKMFLKRIYLFFFIKIF